MFERRCVDLSKPLTIPQSFLLFRALPPFPLCAITITSLTPRAPPPCAQGPYRESFAVYCAELQSDALPLLVRCPNAVNDVGINREKWVPNPAVIGSSSSGGGGGSSRACYAEMLSFLGRLMGVAIRSRQPLALDLPSIVWKQLVRSPITGYVHEDISINWSIHLSCRQVSWLPRAVPAFHPSSQQPPAISMTWRKMPQMQ